MINVGDFPVNATVRIPWNTNAASGASITRSTNGSVKVYKDSSTTERTSSSGITDNEDFDGTTGTHLLVIDLSDNADAGFYAANHDYHVAVTGQTIDGQTVNAWIATFSIENRSTKAITSDTFAEVGQGAPAATISVINAIRYLFKAWRNKSTQTSSQYSLFADDASTVDQKATCSDDSTTATRGEIASGP